MIIKEYHFGKLTIYDHCVVSVMNEGITVTPKDNDVLKEISETYFKGKTFGYISNRINSYSIDPSVYIQTSKIENLVAFAIVTTDSIGLLNTEIEKMFFDKPFEHFLLLEEAIEWIKTTIENPKKLI
ncbi:hypothetical protein [Ulvibacter litoralis]|uniref:SpoIIAA-like n=1 Tax=Ulvibacter litoralis TaxID=227084 RepID=A0A1G7FRN1_9FLAO|nr:hypothetical protein [Ulvibacter litoralis]GHC63767.1 hypothetical protein GCM10008083_31360 [Ulvibacter litoralis]SDE78561.1 hypothetical protein SAMN05421855_102733 [Ulvibacter litoralis]